MERQRDPRKLPSLSEQANPILKQPTDDVKMKVESAEPRIGIKT